MILTTIDDISLKELWDRFHKLRVRIELLETKQNIATSALQFYAKHPGASNRVAVDIIGILKHIDPEGEK